MADPTLLSEIESFLVDRKMEPTTFGRRALGDPNFIRDLRNGRRLWPETTEKVRAFIDENTANCSGEGAAA